MLGLFNALIAVMIRWPVPSTGKRYLHIGMPSTMILVYRVLSSALTSPSQPWTMRDSANLVDNYLRALMSSDQNRARVASAMRFRYFENRASQSDQNEILTVEDPLPMYQVHACEDL